MLWTIVGILLILWLIGLVAMPTIGWLLHVLLVVAIVIAIANLLTGRRTTV